MSAEEDVRLDLVLRRLVQLAGDARDLLATGDWEAALPIQEQFDEQFAALQALSSTHPFQPRHAADLGRLQQVHAENLRLARGLSAEARRQLGEVAKVRRIGEYAPVSPAAAREPRYVDGSA